MKLIFSFLTVIASLYLGVRFGASSDLNFQEVIDLRMPRVLLAFLVGGALALSGLILQILFANPMCEPYTLGVSSGASLGALLFPFATQSGSLAGALFFTFLIQFFDWRGFKKSTLLLMGIMFNFLGSSLVSVVIATRDSGAVQGVLLWLLGDLSRAEWSSLPLLGITLLLSSVFLYFYSAHLDALSLGDEIAKTLGVHTTKIRGVLLLLSSLLISFSVSQVGMIGFVGLLIPHLSRKIWSTQHRFVVVSCLLWGGVFLVLGDLLSRTLMTPYEFPVGVMTALIGAPVYLVLLMSESGKGKLS